MSGRKLALASYKLVNSQSMASSFTSLATNIQYYDNIGIQFLWTGTPTGTFDIQVSADHQTDQNGNVIVVGNWVSLGVTPQPSASGSSGSWYVDLNQLSAPFVRVVYTASGGAGNATITIVGKMI
jgi:hypothetical protein